MHAILHTSLGDITISLFPDEAPETVANFVGLAQGTKPYTTPNASGTTEGPFYDGCTFIDVIKGIFIQGGDPTGTQKGGPGFEFENEIHPDLTFAQPYRVAMANRGPGTNGSQFIITLRPMEHLTGRNPIFGEVADPLAQKVVRDIGAVPTNSDGKPQAPVVIESITVSE